MVTLIYLPVEDFSDYACYSVYSSEVIRAYKSRPAYNSSSDYVNYYINSHYFTTEGTQSWTNYSTLPVCESTDRFTNNYAYRNDFSDILIIAIIIIGSIWFFISKLVKTLLKGRKRY